MTTQAIASLQQIPPDNLKRNPENPRLIFRESDMNDLLQSIKETGIQVPLTVYWDPGEKSHVILDGERRWRCARKLNLQVVPVIVQEKPSRLENLLMMFNIHNVRVDWDLLPMAMKLDTVRELLEDAGKPSGPKELAAISGLRLATVRRAFELLSLPDRYKELLLSESERPRHEQKITADLFVEIYKSLNAIKRYTPEALQSVAEEEYVDQMVSKYQDGVVSNVVHFRDVSKIARAELAGVERREAVPILRKVIRDPSYSIQSAYEDSVSHAYQERDLMTRIDSLEKKLQPLAQENGLTHEVREALRKLYDTIQTLIDRP